MIISPTKEALPSMRFIVMAVNLNSDIAYRQSRDARWMSINTSYLDQRSGPVILTSSQNILAKNYESPAAYVTSEDRYYTYDYNSWSGPFTLEEMEEIKANSLPFPYLERVVF